MTALWMNENAKIEVASSDVISIDESARYPPSTCGGRSTSDDCVWVGRQMLRVLVATGGQDSADAFVKLMRYEGHAVHVVYDRFAALRVAALQHPNVVLLDMDMPLMDGCQVARLLRSNYPSKDCLIIAAAEQADDARRQNCAEAGIDLLLIKPVELEVVETLLMLECVRVNWRSVPRAGQQD